MGNQTFKTNYMRTIAVTIAHVFLETIHDMFVENCCIRHALIAARDLVLFLFCKYNFFKCILNKFQLKKYQGKP